jgi:C-methyltransferase C-terminal domain/Methyltransferase domain
MLLPSVRLPGVDVPNSPPCIVCASRKIVPIFEISALPADTIRLWSSRAAARSAPKAKMGITYCEHCGHLFNRYYNDDLVDYEGDYENSQIFSSRFRRYAEELSDRLIATYNLRQKNIVEVGGGRGDFLRIICDRGNNNGVSFGPSYRPAPEDVVPANIRFVTDYYTAKYAEVPANLIVCRHVLEHFWQPHELIDAVRRAVGDRKDLVVYFEVPNGGLILREQLFWEFIYQHPSYFTPSSLAKLFIICGFQVHDIQESFDGQFLAIEASAPPHGAVPDGDSFCENMSTTAALGWALNAAFNARVASWRDRLEQLRDKRQRVVAWGAGAKAATFLNVVDPVGSFISHVVDINPRKTGRFVPGSGQQIVEPNSLRELHPDVIILMNKIYRDEIASYTAGLGLNPEFLAA